MQRIDRMGVLLGALAFWLFSAIWYLAWGVMWLAALGMTDVQVQAHGPQAYVIAFLMAALSAFGIAYILSYAPAEKRTARTGAIVGLFVGATLAGPTLVSLYVFEVRSAMLVGIDLGYVICGLGICGLVVGRFAKRT